MGYRWTKDRIEPQTIVQSRQVDAVYANYASVVNGGMDRENLPSDCIGAASVNGQALGKATLLDDQSNPETYNIQDSNYGAPYSNTNTRGNRITGLGYSTEPLLEGGGIFTVAEQTTPCEEGMLHIQWRCNVFMPMYWSYYKNFTSTTVNRRRYQWIMKVNGIIVYESAAICQPFFTTNITTMIPISKGDNLVSIGLRVPSKTNEDNNQVMLNWFGGQLYMHNYYR
tara:strand:+ start:11972 stop:12649 length:678 start_codon:yes stop_codon:yes gene_type:complete